MEDVLRLLGIIFGAGGVGAVLAIMSKHLLARRRMVHSHSLAMDQQSYDHMTATIARQEKRIVTLEAMHAECLRKHEEGMAESVLAREQSLREHGELKQEIGRLREVVSRFEDVRLIGGVVADISGKVVEWDVGASQIFHYSRDEALGQRIEDLIIPERYRARHLAALAEVAARKKPMRKEPLYVDGKQKGGSEIPITVFLSEVWDEAGEMRIGAHIRSR